MSKVGIECQECKKTFEVYASRAKANPKFCSVECKFKNIRERESESRKKQKCDNCGVEVMRYNYRNKGVSNVFCGMKCHDEFRSKQVELPCQECGDPFKVKVSVVEKQNPRYCSMKCRDIAYRGENSPLYTMQTRKCKLCDKGFTVKQSQLDVGKGMFCSKKCYYQSMELERPEDSSHFYGTTFWIRLRNECYKRDDETCQRCLSTGVRLDAHHIVPRTFGGKDELENLISLCNSCHHIVEHETRKQFN